MQHRGPRLSKKDHLGLLGRREPRRHERRQRLDFPQALVRRKLLSDDKCVSGIESGTEVFRGKGRPDTKSYSVDIG
jgi:hypothetical protein